ncbi:hypothetical protein ZIOFF_037980 [Zingiber officinale]|uniref:Neprosin PEP catalytic domain-containing protein n=1 Tax=Zingiber officinale TaxID=94328 RepID=A0A8J5LAD6_ZINOF|nr:hypothetical protein ZIOFF_037980 [Zingiber officinale]
MFLRILLFILIGGAQARSWNEKAKYTLKTIQTITGDLFDCIDMYKQPAFDHPLLKNHTLQLKPSSLPKGMKLAKSKSGSFYGFNDTCPSGTVLIHRARKQDLIESKLLRNQFRAQAIANNPTAEGSHVSPIMYGTSYPRFFTFWTIDGYEKTGCGNLECPGFVSTTNIYGPGSFIPEFSTYGGEQKYLSILISRDSSTGNWWVTYNDQLPLGYFPKELLPKMDDYADAVQMGGHVYSPLNVPSPPMGSGHPSNEGPNKAAYFIQVQAVDSSNKLTNFDTEFIKSKSDIGDYYSISDNHGSGQDKYVFAYGGAGGFTK